MSRHRGAKLCRLLHGRLGKNQPVIPRVPFIARSSDGPFQRRTNQITMADFLVSARLVSLAVRRASMPLHSSSRFPTALSPPSRASVTLWEQRPPQSNCPPRHVPDPDNGPRLDASNNKGGISSSWLHRDWRPGFIASHLSYTCCCERQGEAAVKVHRVFPSGPQWEPRIFTGEFNFTEFMLETAGKSLRHSCRSELTRQGISLP